MIGIPIALLVNNAGEWAIHKYVLHGLGRRRQSFWSFHWHEHHNESRKNDMYDPNYERPLYHWNAQTKEALALLALGLMEAPLLPVAPFFTLTSWYCIAKYYRVHKRAHLDPEWARKNVPWHVDHHLGKDQNANWCVTKPWFDHWMGTRKPVR